MSAPLSSPLAGIRVVEFEGIGPGPLAARMLADMGAEVTVIGRPQQGAVAAQLGGSGDNPLRRGKTVVLLDLKQDAARAEALALVAQADALIEGNRPGVMERLKLGPAECAQVNPRIVYGRMTGWGQSGPLAQAAGHDLNYVALTGMLSLSAHRGERPIVPPTVVGDAGGALGLAFGMVCAFWKPKPAARAAWWTPPSSTSWPCWAASRNGFAAAASSAARNPARSTIRRFTTSTAAPTAAASRWARWSRSSTRC
jgi:alpha-methylacyl-CoA racemase